MPAGPEDIAAAVERLAAGGLVAFPTETVYGLGADALNREAIAHVFQLKGRPATNPLIVHVSGEAMAKQVAQWSLDAARLARVFWPGPLTLILPRTPAVPESVTAGSDNVAVRCPDHHLTLSLLEAYGRPLVGPSANPSGRISPTTAEHVRASFDQQQVLVLDGGPCRAGIESTVLALEPTPRILRPGVLGAQEIARALGRPVLPHNPGEVTRGPAPSPGLLAAHYAPRTPTALATRDEILARVAASQSPIVALVLEPVATSPPHASIVMPTHAEAYAARLYAALREADDLHASAILVERPPSSGPIWEAILDRLSRAAAEYRV